MTTKRRFRTFMSASEREFRCYQTTKQDEPLAQAGEKLWNAFNILVEIITKKKIHSFQQIKNASQNLYIQHNDAKFQEAFAGAYDLHKFFYGWTADLSEIESEYIKVRALMIEIARKYKAR